MCMQEGLQVLDASGPRFRISKEGSRCGRPDQRQDTFCYHRAVEDPATLTFIGHAPCHDRTLRAVETRDGAACDAHEHHREERQTVRLPVLKTVKNLRHLTAVPA